jgi:hypothetical protein
MSETVGGVPIGSYDDLDGHGLGAIEKDAVVAGLNAMDGHEAVLVVEPWYIDQDDVSLVGSPRAPRVCFGAVTRESEKAYLFRSGLGAENATEWVPKSQSTLFVSAAERIRTHQRGLGDFEAAGPEEGDG